MASKIKRYSSTRLGFLCPACDKEHQVTVTPDPPYTNTLGTWGWNGDMERPTFSPSIRVRSGHFDPLNRGKRCWCTYNVEHPQEPSGFACTVCHSFITDGMINFLIDCEHSLRGKSVQLTDYE